MTYGQIWTVTEDHVNELVGLIDKFGYWSDQVKEYNAKFAFSKMMRLNERAKVRIKARDRK